MEEQVKTLITERIQLELKDSREVLDKQIGAVVSQHSGRGVLQSSMTAHVLADLFSKCGRERVKDMWSLMHRIVTNANVEVNEATEKDLTCLFSSIAKEYTEELPGYYQERVKKYVRSDDLVARCSQTVKDSIDNEINIQLNEIHLFALNYRTRSKESTTSTINIYGPTASIQTGDNSTAYVDVAINTKEGLRELLRDISSEVGEIDGLSDSEKEDIKAVILEGQEELNKPAPNKTRIRGLLGGISETFKQVDTTLKGAERVHAWGQKIAGALDQLGIFL